MQSDSWWSYSLAVAGAGAMSAAVGSVRPFVVNGVGPHSDARDHAKAPGRHAWHNFHLVAVSKPANDLGSSRGRCFFGLAPIDEQHGENDS